MWHGVFYYQNTEYWNIDIDVHNPLMHNGVIRP